MDEREPARLTVTDAPALVAVTESVGWNHTLDDWRTVLAAGVVFGHRSAAGELLSSAAIFPYGPSLASIGMVTVRPEHQGAGLATDLMRRCLDALPEPPPPTTLVATRQGLPLYQRLGFKTIGAVVKLTAPAAALRWPPHTRAAGVDDAVAGELPAVLALDAEALGADRSAVLRARLAQPACRLAVARGDGELAGYGAATPQRALRVVGPLIARDVRSALALARWGVGDHDGGVRIDVPTTQRLLLEHLAAIGFAGTEEAPLMVLGAAALPGRRSHVFALAARAFA